MDTHDATRVFECLASAIRLEVFRLLVNAGGEGMVAGDIALALELPPSNLSFHLKAMVHAGLVDVEAEGRFQRYRADLSLVAGIVDYLTAQCCSGHPELCAALPSIARRARARRRAPTRKGRQ